MTTDRRLIENSDRGITLNKQLAWTMLAALVGTVWWGGSTVTGLQKSTENLVQAVGETRALIAAERQASAALEARIRALETTSTRQDARFDALSRSVEEIKVSVRESNALLRKITAP